MSDPKEQELLQALQATPLGAMGKTLDHLAQAIKNAADERSERDRRIVKLIERLCSRAKLEQDTELWKETGEVLDILRR